MDRTLSSHLAGRSGVIITSRSRRWSSWPTIFKSRPGDRSSRLVRLSSPGSVRRVVTEIFESSSRTRWFATTLD